MPKIELTQIVQLFTDEDKTITQEIHIDTEDETENWVVINHGGEEISLSCRNFENLIDLYQEAKKQI